MSEDLESLCLQSGRSQSEMLFTPPAEDMIESFMPTEENALFYSGKHKTHCFKYEVVVRMSDGYIYWLKNIMPMILTSIDIGF